MDLLIKCILPKIRVTNLWISALNENIYPSKISAYTVFGLHSYSSDYINKNVEINVFPILLFSIGQTQMFDRRLESVPATGRLRTRKRTRKRRALEDRSSTSVSLKKVKSQSTPVLKQLEDPIEEIEDESTCSSPHKATLHFMQKYLSGNHQYFDLLVIERKQRISVSLESLVEACSTEIMGLRPCILIEGESGCGKTTLLRHMAFEWASKTSKGLKNKLTNFCSVLLYDVHVEFGSKANNLELQLEEDKKYFPSSSAIRPDILILLDMFWIVPDSLIELCRKYFPNASIVFTAQPDLVEEYKSKEIKSITHYYKVLGYESNSIKEALALSLNSAECMQKFGKWISCNDFADALMYRPLYFDMLIELFKNGALPDYLVNLTQLFKLYVVYLINKNISCHPITLYSDLKGNDSLLFKAIVEFSMDLPKIINTKKSDMPESFGLLRKIEFTNHQVLTFENSSIMAYFMSLFCSVSHNMPSNVPFHWPVLWLYLGGMNIFTEKCYNAERYFGKNLQVIFEFQSDFTNADQNILNSIQDFRLIAADPISLYILGWWSAFQPFESPRFGNKYVHFDIPYVSDVSKYISYFSKGTFHNSEMKNTTSVHVDVINAEGNAGECLDILVKSKLQTRVGSLVLSGDIKFESPLVVIEECLSSLQTLDITGSLTPTCNQLLPILPKLKHLQTLTLRSGGTTEIDLDCLGNLTFVNKRFITDFSPDFLKLPSKTCFTNIEVCNCAISHNLMENLVEWVMSGDKPKVLGLTGEKIVTAEIALIIATKFNTSTSTQTKTNDCYEYGYNQDSGIVLKDSSIPSVNVFRIASAVARFKGIKLHIPMKYAVDLKNFPCLKFL